MAYLPSQYSVALMVMFSLDNCSHFVKNETFSNDCNRISASSDDMCCQDLILDLFGDLKVNQCYQDTSYRNYTQLKFKCLHSSLGNKYSYSYLGFTFIILGLVILFCSVIKWTFEVKKNKNEKARLESERITQLNQAFNIQNGKYQTFTEHPN